MIIWGPAPDKEKEKIDLCEYDYIIIFNNHIDMIENFKKYFDKNVCHNGLTENIICNMKIL